MLQWKTKRLALLVLVVAVLAAVAGWWDWHGLANLTW